MQRKHSFGAALMAVLMVLGVSGGMAFAEAPHACGGRPAASRTTVTHRVVHHSSGRRVQPTVRLVYGNFGVSVHVDNPSIRPGNGPDEKKSVKVTGGNGTDDSAGKAVGGEAGDGSEGDGGIGE
jgi:hypothetical protein